MGSGCCGCSETQPVPCSPLPARRTPPTRRYRIMTSPAPTRHRVVIVGSGFGGLTAAKAFKGADVDVTLIAKTTQHLFQPLLYQVATGIISEGEIAPSTRVVLRKQKNVQVLLGEVTDIDLAKQTVKSRLINMETETPYDSL